MLDSGAAVNVCPVDYFREYGIQSGRHIELQGADGSSVEHYGSRDVLYRIGDDVMKILILSERDLHDSELLMIVRSDTLHGQISEGTVGHPTARLARWTDPIIRRSVENALR